MEEFLAKVEMFFELREKIDVNVELLDLMRKNLFEEAGVVGFDDDEKNKVLQSIRNKSIECISKESDLYKFHKEKIMVKTLKCN